MLARGRDQPWLPRYYAVLGRRAACRGRCGVARTLPAHRTSGSVRPAGGAGGDDCSSRPVLGIGGGPSRRARLVRRAGKAEDRHSVGGLWATQRRSCQGVDRGLLPAEMTALCQQLFVDFNDLSDYLEDGCHTTLDTSPYDAQIRVCSRMRQKTSLWKMKPSI